MGNPTLLQKNNFDPFFGGFRGTLCVFFNASGDF